MLQALSVTASGGYSNTCHLNEVGFDRSAWYVLVKRHAACGLAGLIWCWA